MNIPVREYFQAVLSDLNVPDDTMHSLWGEIEARYGESHRYYHRLSHITAMLDQAEALGINDTAITLATLYHDIIYDPVRNDNEAQSAVLFRTRLGTYLPPALCDQVCAMIKATKSHQPTGDRQTDLLLDLDMAILGATWADYETYAANVAREYIPIYGNEAYRTGRAAMFLTPVLAQPRLFLTSDFIELDAKARENLIKERELWATGSFADATGLPF